MFKGIRLFKTIGFSLKIRLYKYIQTVLYVYGR